MREASEILARMMREEVARSYEDGYRFAKDEARLVEEAVEAFVWELFLVFLFCLVVFFILEKVVKLSPTKYDDILLDVVWDGFRKVVGKKWFNMVFKWS